MEPHSFISMVFMYNTFMVFKYHDTRQAAFWNP